MIVSSSLQNASDNRDCENKLVLLLGYDQFQFIKVLFKNRWTVLYCTQLARTENEREREKIETEMKADPEKAAVLKVCVTAICIRERGSVLYLGMATEILNLP